MLNSIDIASWHYQLDLETNTFLSNYISSLKISLTQIVFIHVALIPSGQDGLMFHLYILQVRGRTSWRRKLGIDFTYYSQRKWLDSKLALFFFLNFWQLFFFLFSFIVVFIVFFLAHYLLFYFVFFCYKIFSLLKNRSNPFKLVITSSKIWLFKKKEV